MIMMMIIVIMSKFSWAITLRGFKVSIFNMPFILLWFSFYSRFKSLLSLFTTAPCDAFLDFKISCNLRFDVVVSRRGMTDKILVISPVIDILYRFLNDGGLLELEYFFFSVSATLSHVIYSLVVIVLRLKLQLCSFIYI